MGSENWFGVGQWYSGASGKTPGTLEGTSASLGNDEKFSMLTPDTALQHVGTGTS
jgi:hypothetical protein